ncbi:MAG: hypothetical protein QW639_06485, partial [Candidatus Bathyarchaeia archaeon]
MSTENLVVPTAARPEQPMEMTLSKTGEESQSSEALHPPQLYAWLRTLLGINVMRGLKIHMDPSKTLLLPTPCLRIFRFNLKLYS